MANVFPMSYQPAQIIYPTVDQNYNPAYQQTQMQQPQIQQPQMQQNQMAYQQPNPTNQVTQVQQTTQQIPTPPIMQPAGSNMIFVDGESVADRWVLGKGETVVLFDQNKDVFYVKSVNENGMPMPLEVCSFKRKIKGREEIDVTENAVESDNPINDSRYVTVDEFERRITELNKSIFKLMSSFDSIKDNFHDSKEMNSDEKRIII